MNGVIAGPGSLLQRKPILRMHQGKAVRFRVASDTRKKSALRET
jgi:hypothetical protein